MTIRFGVVAKVHLVSSSVLSSNDGVGHCGLLVTDQWRHQGRVGSLTVKLLQEHTNGHAKPEHRSLSRTYFQVCRIMSGWCQSDRGSAA